MIENNGALGRWWARASKVQREQLAMGMGDSASVLRHIAAGRQGMSVAMAAKIEAAMLGVDGIERLTRFDLRSECASCPHRACGLVPAQGGGQ